MQSNENISDEKFESLENIKKLFEKNLFYYGVKIRKENTQRFIKNSREITINIKNVNPVISRKEDNAYEYNTILTKYEIGNSNLKELEEYLNKNMNDKYKLDEYTITEEEVQVNYNNFSYNEVLKKILADEAPSGFEIIGKIAHLNLREKFLPHKYTIGKVILDKNPGIKTVINKTSKISNVYRTYDMEVLAGDSQFEVIHNEVSCTFQFDIRKVYWCSRLQAERDRIIKKFKKGEILCDAFCGVGPLAIRAAKMGFKVLANDLNPDCFNYININAKRNKIPSKSLVTFNMDAREFIKSVISVSNNDYVDNPFNSVPKDTKVDHIYMNLPKDALEFLDVFVGLFSNSKPHIYTKDSLPIIHVYGFSNCKDSKKDLLDRVAAALGVDVFNEDFLDDFHNVRDVSNNKHMFCLSIKIPPEIGFKI